MLDVSDLSASYETGQVLFDVSINVEEGKIVSLLGRNGSGKTTLLRAIMGANEPTVSGGTITLRGEDITNAKAHERAQRGLTIVPQGRRLWPALTVEENLEVAASQSEDPYEFERIAEFFPVLEEMRMKDAQNMSGGEQQMLAVGRALIGNPDMILMDEPTEGLAPFIVRTLEDAVAEINDHENVTILLVEQQIHTALAVSDHHYIMDQGQIVQEVNSAELRADDELRQRFLGV